MFGFAAVVAEFFAELHNHLIQRARRAIIIVKGGICGRRGIDR
jgi:hypothetical protein